MIPQPVTRPVIVTSLGALLWRGDAFSQGKDGSSAANSVNDRSAGSIPTRPGSK